MPEFPVLSKLRKLNPECNPHKLLVIPEAGVTRNVAMQAGQCSNRLERAQMEHGRI